jgi:hypothetical protein
MIWTIWVHRQSTCKYLLYIGEETMTAPQQYTTTTIQAPLTSPFPVPPSVPSEAEKFLPILTLLVTEMCTGGITTPEGMKAIFDAVGLYVYPEWNRLVHEAVDYSETEVANIMAKKMGWGCCTSSTLVKKNTTPVGSRASSQQPQSSSQPGYISIHEPTQFLVPAATSSQPEGH